MAERAAVALDDYYELGRRFYKVTIMPEPGGGILIQFSDNSSRKLIEDALRKSEEKFSKAFHCSPVPMCIIDIERDSGFLEVNDAFQRVTGYQPDELIGYTSTEVGLYHDLHDREEARIRIMTEGGYQNLEQRFRKKNGDIIVGLVSAESIEINGTLCAIAAAVDITAQRKAEQRLRDSEELYRRLFEVESDAMFLVDQDSGKILKVNPAAVHLYGYTEEELVSMNRVDLSAEPERTVQATTRMEPFTPLRWHRKKSGVVFPVEISNCYFDLKGRTVFVSAIRDITERRAMEQALRTSEEKFSKAFRSNPAAISIVDLETDTFLEVNEPFEEMTGYRRDEVLGRKSSELGISAGARGRDETLAKLLKEGRLRNWECRFHKKDGALRVALLSLDLIDIDGKSCAIIAGIDITERMQLEKQLRQAQKLESLGRLAGGVAHDINNVLTVINGYSDMMVRALQPDDPLYAQAREIKKAGERAASLTNQLLLFSRQKVIEPKPVDLNSIINESKKMLQRLIGEDIELTTTLDPALGNVLMDPGQIQQIILNLALNARDAMPNGGKLQITTGNAEVGPGDVTPHPDAIPGNYVVLTVVDNGVGMDEWTLQNAFEPFFTTKEYGRGTGLGLSTVYGIVRQAGGWIHVSSEMGRGSSFRVHLPRVEAVPVPEIATPAAEPLKGDETILVVEDHEDVRTLTVKILNSYGYHVIEASNGAEALAAARNHVGPIHLLLTDVVMPGMNGKELSDRLRQLQPDLKVLFTSGYTADVIARRGVLEENVAYLPKPFSPERLAAKVREALSIRRPDSNSAGIQRT